MASSGSPIARNNPFTIATNAVQALYSGRPAGPDLWLAVAWAAGITPGVRLPRHPEVLVLEPLVG